VSDSKPLVSVLVTAYNRERFIADAIESVLSQTFRDFELLVVDDHSSDGTVQIARAFERHDRRVRVVVNARNLGQFANRNHSAGLALGSFLKYHDSDDVMYPHCLETMVSMLQAYPDAAFGLSNGVAWPGGPCPMLLTPRMAYQREYLGQGLFMCGPSGALFRAEAFRRLGGFEDVGVPSDYVFWVRACRQVSVVLFPADLFWYREHSGQELRSQRAEREYLQVTRIAWDALGESDCPLSPDERDQARRNTLYALFKMVYADCRGRQFVRAARRLQESGVSVGEWIRWLRPSRRDAFAGSPAQCA
jgi:glycosyltransferase involved in cell wall biosynthesis